MKEQQYQSKIISKFEKDGYYVLNLIKTNKNGVSDILALKSNEPPIFIEVKNETNKLSKLQEYRLTEQKKLGFKVYYTKGYKLIEWNEK